MCQRKTNPFIRNGYPVLKSNANSLDAKVELLAFREPYSLPAEDVWLKNVCSMAKLELTQRAPGCTAANLLSRFNIKSIVFGPGKENDAGSIVNEYVSLHDLEESTAQYVKIYGAQLS